MDNSILYIDIREPYELIKFRFHNDINFINIPLLSIQFNLNLIKKLINEYDTIFLVCKSGNRATYIYNKYFKNDDQLKNIIVHNKINFNNFNIGENYININNLGTLNIKTIINDNFIMNNNILYLLIILLLLLILIIYNFMSLSILVKNILLIIFLIIILIIILIIMTKPGKLNKLYFA